MRGLIVGYGSIGRRHASNLRALHPDAEVIVWRRPTRAETPGPGERWVFSLEEAVSMQPDFAVICTPAHLHVEQAVGLVSHGIPVLVEKPLSSALDRVDELIEASRSRGLPLMVAYNLRFDASLRRLRDAVQEGRVGRILAVRAEVGQYLPDWRPDADYRLGPTASRAAGGGVLLELSHEMDYVRWLFGEIRDVTAVTAKLSDLDIDVEDCAEIVCRSTEGAMISLHLDMVQRVPTRTCRVIGATGTLEWDGIAGTVRWFSVETRAWTDLAVRGPAARNEMYVDELRHFLDCVRDGSTPLVTGEDGRRVLELMLAAGTSSERKTAVTV